MTLSLIPIQLFYLSFLKTPTRITFFLSVASLYPLAISNYVIPETL